MTTDTTSKHGHLLSDKQFFILNNCALVIFPGLGTLYFALAQIWGLPAAQQVIGSIVALDTFLGLLIKVGESSYDQSGAKYSGAINVTETPEKIIYSLDMNHDPEELKDKTEATFKINKHPSVEGLSQ